MVESLAPALTCCPYATQGLCAATESMATRLVAVSTCCVTTCTTCHWIYGGACESIHKAPLMPIIEPGASLPSSNISSLAVRRSSRHPPNIQGPIAKAVTPRAWRTRSCGSGGPRAISHRLTRSIWVYPSVRPFTRQDHSRVRTSQIRAWLRQGSQQPQRTARRRGRWVTWAPQQLFQRGRLHRRHTNTRIRPCRRIAVCRRGNGRGSNICTRSTTQT